MCFSDLRQLLDLFVAWDWATYFADYGKTEKSKYQRVQPATALAILEKLKEADKKSVFGNISLNKKERDKVLFLIFFGIFKMQNVSPQFLIWSKLPLYFLFHRR